MYQSAESFMDEGDQGTEESDHSERIQDWRRRSVWKEAIRENRYHVYRKKY